MYLDALRQGVAGSEEVEGKAVEATAEVGLAVVAKVELAVVVAAAEAVAASSLADFLVSTSPSADSTGHFYSTLHP